MEIVALANTKWYAKNIKASDVNHILKERNFTFFLQKNVNR